MTAADQARMRRGAGRRLRGIASGTTRRAQPGMRPLVSAMIDSSR